MPIIGVIAIIVVAVLVVTAAILWAIRFLRHQEANELNRYLQDENSQWKRNTQATGGSAGESVYFVNGAPELQGIEMRVYYYGGPADGSRGDDDDFCLSIISQEQRTGMILNGFIRPLEAMQFGDSLWNDRFLSDAGIMEEMITEKRVAWNQMEEDVIIANFHMFM
jgi:hypothetical protein